MIDVVDTVYTVDTVDTTDMVNVVDMVYTVDMVDTVATEEFVAWMDGWDRCIPLRVLRPSLGKLFVLNLKDINFKSPNKYLQIFQQ